jgi:hypothetical protein
MLEGVIKFLASSKRQIKLVWAFKSKDKNGFDLFFSNY